MTSRIIADRYELADRLGAGGGGTVWRAHDLQLDRTVALKEIEVAPTLPQAERERVQTRALREARAAARLEHPNAVGVYDVRSDDDAIHIVMEYVDAPSLQTLVDEGGPLSPDRAARIGVGVLGALEAAHAEGIVHRDVKPSNVLVGDDGVHVTDFGIATVAGDTALTSTGETLGTPDYVSPEQVSDGEVGPATDLWSLGATLYFAVEGRSPFRRDRPIATVHAVVNDAPRPPERAGALEPMLQDLLAKAPGDRPDLDRVRARLAAVAEGREDPGAPVAGHDRTARLTTASAAATTVQSPASAAPTPARDTPARGGVVTGSPADARGRRRMAMIGATVAVVLLALVALAALTSGGDDPADSPTVAATDDDAEQPTDAASATPSASPTPTPTPTPTPDPTTAAPAGPEAGQVPQEWQTYEGPTYTVGHPPGWQTRDAGAPNNIDLVAPQDQDGYLRVAHTDEPAADALQDTQAIEEVFREEHADYQRIRLERTDYRDFDAAIWEYTYTVDGQSFHALHLNFVTGPRGYALNHVVPEAGWSAAPDRFERFRASFSQR